MIRKKIMMVEDDTSICELYSLKFEKEWFEVMVCNNWLEALTQIVAFLPDIVLLDIMLPQMDGFEVIKAIKELTTTLNNTKIVIFSNLSDVRYKQKLIASGASDYIVKADITPKDMVEKIKDYFL